MLVWYNSARHNNSKTFFFSTTEDPDVSIKRGIRSFSRTLSLWMMIRLSAIWRDLKMFKSFMAQLRSGKWYRSALNLLKSRKNYGQYFQDYCRNLHIYVIENPFENSVLKLLSIKKYILSIIYFESNWYILCKYFSTLSEASIRDVIAGNLLVNF